MGKWFIKNGIYMSLLSIVVALFSCLKEIVFAGYFGVSAIADAYTIAIMIPETLFAVVWTAMNTILIPTYQERLYKGGKKQATRFSSVFLTAICVISLGFILFSEVFAEVWVYLFAPGFSGEIHDLTVKLSRWVFPMLFFDGIIRVCSGIMQIYKNFMLPKALVMIRNTGIIIFVILFANEFGVFAAVFGMITGVVLESFLAFVVSRKYEKIRILIDFKDKYLIKAGKQAIPIIVGTGVSELNQLADKVVASFLTAGSMIALQYASKLEGIITTVILLNAVTLVFPMLSENVAKGLNKEVSQLYEGTIKMIIMLSVPIITGGFLLGKEIITVAFVRGAFDEVASNTVAPLFSIYLLASLFITVRSITVNLFASYGETKTVMKNSILAVVINILLNIVLSYFWGVLGLAIASCISAVVVSLRLVYLANKKLVPVNFKSILVLFIKSFTSAIVMGISVFAIKHLIGKNIETNGQIQIISCLIFLILIGGCIYLAMLSILKTQEVNKIKGLLKKQGRREI